MIQSNTAELTSKFNWDHTSIYLQSEGMTKYIKNIDFIVSMNENEVIVFYVALMLSKKAVLLCACKKSNIPF